MIADARADGTEDNGVHDVSGFDFETPIPRHRDVRRPVRQPPGREWVR